MDLMREFLTSRRPTPAMAVAFIALLAALSGTAVALPGKNTVDSADIKNKQVKNKDLANNAVAAKKVKNGSLTGADIKDDSLTGSDVNESTLGQVPSANTANSANSAGSATRANSAGTVDQIDPSDASFLTEGQTRVVLTRGPVTVTHLCLDGNNNNVGESAFQFTTTEGAAVVGQVSLFLTGDTGALFAPGTPGVFGVPTTPEGFFAGSGVVTGPGGNTLFNVNFQLVGEGTLALINTTAECGASINAVE
jgi:hypothetical protein